METKTRSIGILIVFFVILIIIGALYFFFDRRAVLQDLGDGREISAPEGDTGVAIKPLPDSSTKGTKPIATPPPSLDRPIIFSDSTRPDTREKMRQDIGNLITLLKGDSANFNAWMDLAFLRHTTDDYEGARQAWEYASLLRPKNSLSYSNLGNLYGYYLGDAVSAERNLLQALENDPKNIYVYIQTYRFYLEVAKDSGKARAAIEKGVTENPTDQDLKKILEEITATSS